MFLKNPGIEFLQRLWSIIDSTLVDTLHKTGYPSTQEMTLHSHHPHILHVTIAPIIASVLDCVYTQHTSILCMVSKYTAI